MRVPTHADAFEVLCLQAADEGRGAVLFGDSFARARKTLRPFMVGTEFPDVYLEFPLRGEPFLDVTVLLRGLEEGTRINAAEADGTGEMLDWYAKVRRVHRGVSCGFELDTKDPRATRAAIHFQPRALTELVEPFCATVGEPERGRLYLDCARRMPQGWPLSFFGMFRGRTGSPLRVCGYMDPKEKDACANDPDHVRAAFDAVGFSAYDDAMLAQVCALIATTDGTIDFQFDVHADGSLGDMFAIDVQFGIAQPRAVRSSFANGTASRVMGLLQRWGAADDRWRLGADAAFATALDVQREDGGVGRYAFTLMPQWTKARWIDGRLCPAKLYYLGSAGFL